MSISPDQIYNVDIVVNCVTGLPDYHLFHTVNPYLRIKTSDGQVLKSEIVKKGGINPHFREHLQIQMKYTSGVTDLTIEVLDQTKRKGSILLASGSLDVLFRKDCMDLELELDFAHGDGKAMMEYSFWQPKNTVSTISGVTDQSTPTSLEDQKVQRISKSSLSSSERRSMDARLSFRDAAMLEVLGQKTDVMKENPQKEVPQMEKKFTRVLSTLLDDDQ
jgi:hypothetical protein